MIRPKVCPGATSRLSSSGDWPWTGAQGSGLGSLLLIDALRRVEVLSEQVGIRAVEVNAIDDAARNFYLKFGFVPSLMIRYTSTSPCP